MAEDRARQKRKRRKAQNVLPVNTKAKDTFFKKVYESEERQRRLVSFLLGIDAEKVAVARVRPVLFGNKENDFSCRWVWRRRRSACRRRFGTISV